jgi:alpha/beta superfamily hydrolase
VSDSAIPASETVEFAASDGARLVGDLVVPSGATAGAIVCHPHPAYGGDRFNHVVDALFRALPTAGVAALRFDFRDAFDDGRGERLDALAAVDMIAGRVDAPVLAVGYSFGALIALALDDERLAATVAVAPPLAVGGASDPPTRPTLVLTPTHDQFSPPDASDRVIDGWRRAGSATVEHRTVETADHSLVGHTAGVARTTIDWIDTIR